jgi:hypothetical protein
MNLLDAVVPELVLRERIEIGRWATETLAALGGVQHPIQGLALAVAANMALVEGKLDEAERLSRQSLALEPQVDAPPVWLSRNVLALVCVAVSQMEDGEVLLAELLEISAVSGDPMPGAVALFDRALIASFSTNPAGGLVWAEELLSLGDQWQSVSLRAMGLVSIGRVLATKDPERA